MAKHVVATVDEIPPGERKIVELEGRSLGVFNINGEFYAVRNICPHQGAPLCEGRLTGLLQSDVPGEYTYTRKGEILRCVWHGWEFDIKTGQSWWNPAQKRVKKYPVEVEDGATVASGLQKGPYTAETYSVSIDQQYVVIDMPE